MFSLIHASYLNLSVCNKKYINSIISVLTVKLYITTGSDFSMMCNILGIFIKIGLLSFLSLTVILTVAVPCKEGVPLSDANTVNSSHPQFKDSLSIDLLTDNSPVVVLISKLSVLQGNVIY